MEFNVKTLEGADAGKVSLSDEIFGLDPRQDILARVVRWQLAKKQQGTHKTKNRSEQPNPWNHLQLQVAKSRHRGAKPSRRCGLLGKISLLSLE